MNKINILKIDKYLVKPIYIQVALDVKWDKAWKIPFTSSKPKANDISKFLEQGGSKLAFELFYETNYSGKFLCGSYFERNDIIQTKDAFLANVFDIVFNNDISKISTVIEYMSNRLGNEEEFFKGVCTEVELGILDFWRFYPACTILESTGKDLNIDLSDKLRNFPYLKTNKDNTALLELVCDYKPLHFVGFTVSDKKNDMFELSSSRTLDIIQDLLGD